MQRTETPNLTAMKEELTQLKEEVNNLQRLQTTNTEKITEIDQQRRDLQLLLGDMERSLLESLGHGLNRVLLQVTDMIKSLKAVDGDVIKWSEEEDQWGISEPPEPEWGTPENPICIDEEEDW